jgi:hypothetical protein
VQIFLYLEWVNLYPMILNRGFRHHLAHTTLWQFSVFLFYKYRVWFVWYSFNSSVCASVFIQIGITPFIIQYAHFVGINEWKLGPPLRILNAKRCNTGNATGFIPKSARAWPSQKALYNPVFLLAKTLVKTLAKTLVKTLAKTLVKTLAKTLVKTF